MATNHRIFWAVEAVGFAGLGSTAYTAAHGVQAVGATTKLDIKPIFELGQLNLYESYDEIPDIDVTASKLLDGYPLLGHWATYGSPDISLVGRSNQRCMVAMNCYGETQQNASGVPISQVTMSGMYLNSWAFDITVGGPASENITLVGNNKTLTTGIPYTFSGNFVGNDVPFAAEGVDHRQDVLMGNCTFPKSILGISSSGTNDMQADGTFPVHFQTIKTSVGLNRATLVELGHKAPYFRPVEWPVETRTEFDVIAVSGDMFAATEAGTFGNGTNVQNETIFIQMREGTKINLGTLNKLNNIQFTAGGAGAKGANATLAYSYVGWDTFAVQHLQDPSPGLAG